MHVNCSFRVCFLTDSMIAVKTLNVALETLDQTEMKAE